MTPKVQTNILIFLHFTLITLITLIFIFFVEERTCENPAHKHHISSNKALTDEVVLISGIEEKTHWYLKK